MLSFDDEPDIHPNALKHLTEEQVRCAWASVVKTVQRDNNEDPTQYLSIGFLDDGSSVELIYVEYFNEKEQTVKWLIFHAMSPVQKKFSNEIDEIERRKK